jgi:hypothetical protein
VRRIRIVLLALLAVATVVAPLPAATAEPGGAVLSLDLTFACFGCGVTSGSLTGTVLAGEGPLRTGATVTGSFTATQPAPTCPADGTGSGTLSTSDGYTTAFSWERLGTVTALTLRGYGSGTGTATIIGNPCGGPGTVTQRVAVWRWFDPFGFADSSAPFGEITVVATRTGGAELFLGGAFAEAGPFRCDLVATSGELVGYCDAGTRLPQWPCARVEAEAQVYPARSGVVLNPLDWGALSTTAVCQATWPSSTTTTDATMTSPVTRSSGVGSGSFYRFECRLRRSSWGAAALPRAPYRASCRTYGV